MSIFKSLRTAPGFTIAAVLTLGIGIGANVACFSVIHAVLLKPLGYLNPDRLVLISGGAAPVEEIKSAARSFSGIAAYAIEEDLAFTGRGTPEVLKTTRVSTNFLEVLGVSPPVEASPPPTTPYSSARICGGVASTAISMSLGGPLILPERPTRSPGSFPRILLSPLPLSMCGFRIRRNRLNSPRSPAH